MRACVRALHVLAAKDIAAATSAVRVIRSPFEISVHSRIFVESSDRANERASEREERGQNSAGRPRKTNVKVSLRYELARRFQSLIWI